MTDNPVNHKLITNGQDYPWIVSSYVNSHYVNEPFNHCHPSIYYPECEKFIKRLLSKSLVMLSHIDDDEDKFISYVVYQYDGDGLVIHYAYTKGDNQSGFRKQGLIFDTIKLIMPEQCNFIIATHYPRSERLWLRFKKEYPMAVYDPFYLLRTNA